VQQGEYEMLSKLLVAIFIIGYIAARLHWWFSEYGRKTGLSFDLYFTYDLFGMSTKLYLRQQAKREHITRSS